MAKRRLTSGLAIATAALAALLGAAPGAQARDVTVTSFDGTPIAVSFFPAEGLAAGQRAPTVLKGHGWGLNRDMNENSSTIEQFGQIGVGPLRHAGYNVLTWDARGFGQSGGTVQADYKGAEGRDVQALVDWLATQPEAQLDGPNDPRVGMTGASYAGGIEFVAAAIDRRIDVIAPSIAWHSLLTSLYKDQAFKSGWASGLYGLGLPASLAEGLVGPNPNTGTLDPHITSAFASGMSTGAISDADAAWFDSRGPTTLVGTIGVPVLILQGTADTLFTLREAMENFADLSATGVPLKMMWFCGGHGVCITPAGEAGHLEAAVIAWMNRWLRGDAAVATGPRFEWVDDAGTWRSAAGFPLAPLPVLSGSGSGTLALNGASDANSSGAQIAATPGTRSADVALAAPAGPLDVVGAPQLKLTYKGTASPPRTFVYAQLLDAVNNRILGNQVTPIPVTLDGAEHAVARPLEPVAVRATTASRYRLQIVPGTNVYGQPRSSGSIAMSKIDISLPIGDAAATGAGGGRLGPGGRSRSLLISRIVGRARTLNRKRRLVVRVSASERVRSVRVVVRNSRHRLIGRSRLVTVPAGRRRIGVRLRHRLRRAGYRVTATGRWASDGARITARRRARFSR
jgi:ABC-2 type transport system ATP-binding protein